MISVCRRRLFRTVQSGVPFVTVKRLRSKLEGDPAKPEYLKTVYGIGYTWAVKP